MLSYFQTAVASIGGGEIHLVAMHSRKDDGQGPCFWGFNVASSIYNSCLVMLNLRCLGIVFDLDETLIVANTMRSFEDRIEALQRKVNSESDPQRVSGMLAEIKRYHDDKSILKQYAESDQVIENGKVIKSQSEVVPALSETHQPIVRPLIRLQDKNIILTRINPLVSMPFSLVSFILLISECSGSLGYQQYSLLSALYGRRSTSLTIFIHYSKLMQGVFVWCIST